MPKCTIGPASCSSNSNSVTMAKLPPPPRRAQKRSGFSVSEAVSTSPSAVTARAETRLSIASPYFRLSQPMPPPRVSPPTPVWLTRPTGTASPCSCVAASRAPSSAPPPTFARRAAGSTLTWFIRLRSMTRPSSTTHEPDMLCAPHRTAISTPCAAANRTAACTSDSSAHMATASGRRSMAAFQTRRASSYVGSAGLDDLAAQRAAEVGDRGVRGLGHGVVPPSMCAGGRCTVARQRPAAQPSEPRFSRSRP